MLSTDPFFVMVFRFWNMRTLMAHFILSMVTLSHAEKTFYLLSLYVNLRGMSSS